MGTQSIGGASLGASIGAQPAYYTIAKLNFEVRTLLESNYRGVWVEAEVIDCMQATSGHVYFTLADPGGKAQIRAVMWRGQAMRYGKLIQKGAAIRCHGKLTVYEPRGSYQFVADRVEEAGAGLRARQLAELKAKLTSEGLFALDRKRDLPAMPNCIGVVTSRDGAAIRDIIKVLERRFPVRLVLAHCAVQGATAPKEIAESIRRLAQLKDIQVLIVGRGGGATEDLDAFNAEVVVRAVAEHPCPVVSAVGHEIDISLVDLVADCRAATPSEAAELVVPEIEALKEQIDDFAHNLKTGMSYCLSGEKSKIAVLEKRLHATDPRVRLSKAVESLAKCRASLLRWPDITVERARAKLISHTERIKHWPPSALPGLREELASLREPLMNWQEPALANARGEFSKLVAQLDALSPLASFARGYAMVKRKDDGEIVRDAADAPVGCELDVTLAKGSLVCEVKTSSSRGED